MRILTGAALALTASAIDVEKLLKSMTLEEKIGQLNQITINEFLSAPAQINYTKVSLVILSRSPLLWISSVVSRWRSGFQSIISAPF